MLTMTILCKPNCLSSRVLHSPTKPSMRLCTGPLFCNGLLTHPLLLNCSFMMLTRQSSFVYKHKPRRALLKKVGETYIFSANYCETDHESGLSMPPQTETPACSSIICEILVEGNNVLGIAYYRRARLTF